MPSAPTIRMRTLAARWLTDRIAFSTVTYPTDTRPLGKATTLQVPEPSSEALTDDDGNVLTDDDGNVLTTDDGDAIVAALIRQPLVDLTDSQTVRRDVRELRIWCADDQVAPVAGMRCTIIECADVSLVGRFGEVIDVDRDSIRAVRRLTVRIANDA